MSEAKGSRKTGRIQNHGPPTLKPCSPSWRMVQVLKLDSGDIQCQMR
nr:MAG TPA: hypothetical protein [Caudoviricetes sp.]